MGLYPLISWKIISSLIRKMGGYKLKIISSLIRIDFGVLYNLGSLESQGIYVYPYDTTILCRSISRLSARHPAGHGRATGYPASQCLASDPGTERRRWVVRMSCGVGCRSMGTLR